MTPQRSRSSVTGAGSENGAANCTAGAWTYTFVSSLAVNGAYSITATQTDAAANSATSGAKAITVDTTAPVVTLTTVNGTVRSFPFVTNSTVTTLSGACGSASGDAATVSVAITGTATQNGTAPCSAGVWTYTAAPTLSANGTYSVTATQTDTATNTGSSGAQSITINTAAPVVTLATVNGTARTFPFITNTTVTTLGGTCTTAAGVNATVSIAITGASTQNGTATCTTSAWTFTPTTALSFDGIYSVTATQTDTASNVGTSGAQSITVDKTTPVVTLATVNGTARTFPYISNNIVTALGGACGAALGDSGSIAVSITGTSTQSGTGTCTAGTWTYTPATALSADGAYTITATQTDTAANTGTTGAQSLTVDRTAPAVTLTTVNGTARTFPLSINVTATTVGGACGIAAGDASVVAVAVTGTATQNGTASCTAGAWTYTFSPALATSGTYNVTATQTDTATNTGTSGAQAITVQTSAPVVTVTSVNGTARTFPYTTNATVTTVGGACTIAAGVSTTVSVAIAGASTQNGSATCSASTWTYTPTTALSADGAYTVTATQSDSASNVGTSGAQAITVDKTAPVVTLTSVNGTARTFPLLTNAVATTVGGACGIATGDATTVSVSVTGAGSENGTATCAASAWTYTFVSSLAVNGAYSVTATQTDAAANSANTGAKAITVDTTAPVVTLTTVNGTVRTFPFTTNTTVTTVGGACGTASGDPATVAVAITGASTQSGTATCTAGTWTFTPTTALSANGSYSITATQTDTATNTGTSGAQSVTINTAAPVVTLTNVNAAARAFPYTTNATVTTVGGACTTAAGVNPTVSVAITGSSTQNGTAACTTGAWTFTPATALSADGIYSVTATQTDTASNVGTSGAQSITVDKTSPVVTLTNVNAAPRTFPYISNTTVTTVGGACGSSIGDSASIAVAITGASTQNGTATCTAGSWTYTPATALSVDGAYSITATQTDAAANSGNTGAKAITVDATVPVVTLTTVNGTARTFPLSINVVATAVGGACGTAAGDSTTVAIAVTGSASQNGTATCTAGAWTYTFAPALSTSGTYNVTATQTDTATNTGTSGAKAITVQTAAPVVSLTSVNGAVRTFPYTTSATVTTVGGACTIAAGVSTTISVTITGASTQSGSATCASSVWTFTPTTAFATDGAYTVTATQSDSASNVGTSGAQLITIDKTTPVVTLTTVSGTARTFPFLTNVVATSVGGTCGTVAGDAATVAVSVTGAGSENGAANCTAGAWTYTFISSLAVNGAYSITATQTDTAANIGTSGAKTITIDTTAPVVTLTTVNGTVRTFPYTTNTTIATVGGACGIGSGDSATVSVAVTGSSTQSGTATCTAGAWAFTPTTALTADGTYTFTATQTDTATNTGSSGATSVSINTVAPLVTLDDRQRHDPHVPLQHQRDRHDGRRRLHDRGRRERNRVGGDHRGEHAERFGGVHDRRLHVHASTALSADGVYSITATQSDTSGNTGTSGARSITVDKTLPVVTLTTVNGTARTFPYSSNVVVATVGGACGAAIGDGATVAVAITGTATQNGTATCSAGLWTYSLTTLLSVTGTYVITGTQTDAAANSGTTGAQTINLDATAPVVTLTSLNGTARTFPYSTNVNATSVGGACGVLAGDSATVSVAVTGTTTQNGTAPCTAGAWTYTFAPALSAAGTYNVTATQTDSFANVGTSGAQSVVIDTTPPVVTLTQVNGTARTFPLSTNVAATSVGGACGIVDRRQHHRVRRGHRREHAERHRNVQHRHLELHVRHGTVGRGHVQRDGNPDRRRDQQRDERRPEHQHRHHTAGGHAHVGERHRPHVPLLDQPDRHVGRRRVRHRRR